MRIEQCGSATRARYEILYRNGLLKYAALLFVMSSAGSFREEQMRKTYRKELCIQTPGKHNFKMIKNEIPVSMAQRPFLHDVDACHIKHLLEAVIMGKYLSCFGDFTELTVQSFDGICCIYYLPDLNGICEKCYQILPVVFQLLMADGYCLPHFSLSCNKPQ